MSQESESLHIKFEGPSGNEVVIRHGQAEPIHVHPAISLSGNFGTPAEFVKKRIRTGPDSQILDNYRFRDCHVTFNEKNLSITLVAGEQERDSITVTGSLKKNPFLELLRINSDTGHNHRDLLKLIRFKPHLFADREVHRKLVLGLQQFEVKTSSNVRDTNDRKGSTEQHYDAKAESKLAGQEVVLLVPMFEGQEPAPINLTVEIEPNNGTVLIFLVSETFEEFYDTAVKAQFDAQRPVFEPFVIIEK